MPRRAPRRSARIKAKNKSISYKDPSSESEESSESETNASTTSQSSSSSSSPSDASESSSSSSDHQIECICGEPNDDRIMICCDKCSIWYHHDCVHLTVSKVNALSTSHKEWLCPSCTKQLKKKKKRRMKRKRSKSRHSPPSKRRKINETDHSLGFKILEAIRHIKAGSKGVTRADITNYILSTYNMGDCPSFNASLRKTLASMIDFGVLSYGTSKRRYKMTNKGKREHASNDKQSEDSLPTPPFPSNTFPTIDVQQLAIRRAFDTSSTLPNMRSFELPFAPSPVDRRAPSIGTQFMHFCDMYLLLCT